MQSINRRLPIDGEVVTHYAVPSILIRVPHTHGNHCISWHNYPKDTPTIFKIFSHSGDHQSVKEGKQRVYHATSIKELLSIVSLIYAKIIPGDLEGPDLVKSILQQDVAPGGDLFHPLLHLQADIIEYCDENKLDFDFVVSQAQDLFLAHEEEAATNH